MLLQESTGEVCACEEIKTQPLSSGACKSGKQTWLILRVAQTNLQMTEVRAECENRFSHGQSTKLQKRI